MRTFVVKYRYFWSVAFIVWSLIFMTACGWAQEASDIIKLLVPAIEAALGILAAFGLGLAPNVLTQVQVWARSAEDLLVTQVQPLINRYDDAPAEAKPGILEEIRIVIAQISDGLNTILPDIRVTNPETQKKIMLVIQTIATEIDALLALVPALKKVAEDQHVPHDELRKLFHAVKGPGDFKHAFNEAVAPFGEKYKLK